MIIDYNSIRIMMPFILVFSLTFSLLQSTGFLGKNKGINAIIGVAFGLLFVKNSYLVDLTEKLGGKVALMTIALLLVITFIGVLFGDKTHGIIRNKGFLFILFIIVGLIIVYSLTSGLPGIDCDFSNFMSCVSDDFKKFIIFLGVIIGVIIVASVLGKETKSSSSTR